MWKNRDKNGNLPNFLGFPGKVFQVVPRALEHFFVTYHSLPPIQERTCEVNRIGENSSYFTCYVKIIPVYNFKLVWVVLHPSVNEFSKRFTNKSKITMFHS